MKSLRVAILLSVLASPTASAETKTVPLSVPSMNCELCPLTIKKAISKVPGVAGVDASHEKKQAVVTFDDSKTSVQALMKATANAGFPSTVKP